MILIFLERCALGTRLVDLQAKYHIAHYLCGQIITWFSQWIQDHWIWLIRDNLAYWFEPANGQPNGQSLAEISANAVRNKLISHYGQTIDPVGPDGFKLAFFIYCMITESSRTAGGPRTAGQFAARFPGMIYD